MSVSVSVSWSRRVVAGVVAVSALALSGCGAAGPGIGRAAGPGVGVRVGSESITASDVDQTTTDFCKAVEPGLASNGTVLPMGFVRAYVVRALTLRSAAEQLAEQEGVTLPASYADAVRQLRSQLAPGVPASKLDLAVRVESISIYVQAVETAVGAKLTAQAGTASDDDAAHLSRGQDALEQWLSEHPADINPRYGVSVSTTDMTSAPTLVDTGSTYALSEHAVAGAKPTPDQAYAATLPSTQRCG